MDRTLTGHEDIIIVCGNRVPAMTGAIFEHRGRPHSAYGLTLGIEQGDYDKCQDGDADGTEA